LTQTECIPDTQFGFMRDKGVVDALAISRQLASLTINLDEGTMFRCYLDLVKAYDRVNRRLMWELLKRYGVPELVVSVIQSFHEGARARVRLQGEYEYSESFALETGLKQGSVLSPTLFNIFLGAIVHEARKEYVDAKLGIPINANPFWDLLGRRRTHHQQRKRLTEILFADDMELVAKSARDLKAMLSVFDRIARTFGQLISAKKSKVVVIKRGQGHEQVTIMVGEDQLEVVEEFRYLGSFEHKTGSMSCEMASRKNTGKMNAAYHGFKYVLLDKRLADAPDSKCICGRGSECIVWVPSLEHDSCRYFPAGVTTTPPSQGVIEPGEAHPCSRSTNESSTILRQDCTAGMQNPSDAIAVFWTCGAQGC